MHLRLATKIIQQYMCIHISIKRIKIIRMGSDGDKFSGLPWWRLLYKIIPKYNIYELLRYQYSRIILETLFKQYW